MMHMRPGAETADQYVPDPEIPTPDVSAIVTEDDQPVDNIYSEKQQRLLTEPLYASWGGPLDEKGAGRPFFAAASVGVFATVQDPPLVPDVLVSLDAAVHPSFLREKRHRTYFIWEHGKPPDVVIEVVSNRGGDELGRRRRGYARLRVAYYVVWDPA
ncbi:MAG: Uma2 family endonuclease, partial [Deltaproteobacteria bacterium]|nr:Uma2 family endonuclease [Deltaproteobacteria bacterium]